MVTQKEMNMQYTSTHKMITRHMQFINSLLRYVYNNILNLQDFVYIDVLVKKFQMKNLEIIFPYMLGVHQQLSSLIAIKFSTLLHEAYEQINMKCIYIYIYIYRKISSGQYVKQSFYNPQYIFDTSIFIF